MLYERIALTIVAIILVTFFFVAWKIQEKVSKERKYISKDRAIYYFPLIKTFNRYIYLYVSLIILSFFPTFLLILYYFVLKVPIRGFNLLDFIIFQSIFSSVFISVFIFYHFAILRYLHQRCLYSKSSVENRFGEAKRKVTIRVEDIVKITFGKKKVAVLNSILYKHDDRVRTLILSGSRKPKWLFNQKPRPNSHIILSREVDEEYYPDTPAYVLSDGAKEVVLFLAPALNEQQERDLHEYIQWLIKRNGLIKTGENVWEKPPLIEEYLQPRI